MASRCSLCGCTEAESLSDARTLSLQEEFETGVYTCCQIAAWADEQALAWFEAEKEDAQRAFDKTHNARNTDAEGVLVPVRLRWRLAWFRRM